MQLWQSADLFPHIMDGAGNIAVLIPVEGAVGGQRAVQFTEQPFIIDDEAELLLGAILLKQPVHPRDRLQQVMLLQRLAHIQHCVAGGIKAGQQLRHNDKDLRIA